MGFKSQQIWVSELVQYVCIPLALIQLALLFITIMTLWQLVNLDTPMRVCMYVCMYVCITYYIYYMYYIYVKYIYSSRY